VKLTALVPGTGLETNRVVLAGIVLQSQALQRDKGCPVVVELEWRSIV
jgi:hypothetical protein